MKTRVIIRYPKQIPFICSKIGELPADGSHEVVIKPVKTTRSIEQNNLYWMWVGVLGDESGYTKKQMHDALRGALLEPVTYPDLATGEMKQRLRSTTELSVKEFTAYLNEIEQWANDFLGCMLPRPEDQYNLAMGYTRVKHGSK